MKAGGRGVGERQRHTKKENAREGNETERGRDRDRKTYKHK